MTNLQRGEHHNGINYVGENVAHHDAHRRCASHLRTSDEILLLDGQGFASEHTGESGPQQQRYHEHNRRESAPHNGDQDQRQEDGWKRQLDVYDAHYQGVYPPTAVSSDQAEEGPYASAQGDGKERDRQGYTGSVDDAAEDVKSLAVSAQEVGEAPTFKPSRRLQPVRQVDFYRVVGRNHVGKYGWDKQEPRQD